MGLPLLRILIALAIAGLCVAAWSGQFQPLSQLERIQQSGRLVVATRTAPSTYLEGRAGAQGMEYDLARRFADYLGVQLELRVADDARRIEQWLVAGDADLAAAGLAATAARRRHFVFTEPYLQVRPQLIYRTGTGRAPRDLSEIGGEAVLLVRAGSHHIAQLEALAPPGLRWEARAAGADELLYQVWNREADHALVNSNEFALNQHFYPELRVAFDLGEPVGIAWMLARQEDVSLFREADRFMRSMQDNGVLADLKERYYGHLVEFDYVGTRVFMRHVTERLPRLREVFERASETHGLDWRLLAAIGYQESHWDPDAVSPTGVRGIMMLTRVTAGEVGVENRVDPEQSIRGGATYFSSIRERIPERIPEPTRTWFALAAYNVGFGHLEDARVITEMQGADPDAWGDVKERLPLLARKEWYSRVRHGYARGWEPVRYVENIRTYYNLLQRVTEPGRQQAGPVEAGNPGPPTEPRGEATPASRLGLAMESVL